MEEETQLANWTYSLAERFMGVSKHIIFQKAEQIANLSGKSFNTPNGGPSEVI